MTLNARARLSCDDRVGPPPGWEERGTLEAARANDLISSEPLRDGATARAVGWGGTARQLNRHLSRTRHQIRRLETAEADLIVHDHPPLEGEPARERCATVTASG